MGEGGNTPLAALDRWQTLENEVLMNDHQVLLVQRSFEEVAALGKRSPSSFTRSYSPSIRRFGKCSKAICEASIRNYWPPWLW